MSIGTSTRKKNSGILRYTFGNANGERTGQFNALIGQANPEVLVCLGADSEVTPDEDDQVFGEFPVTQPSREARRPDRCSTEATRTSRPASRLHPS